MCQGRYRRYCRQNSILNIALALKQPERSADTRFAAPSQGRSVNRFVHRWGRLPLVNDQIACHL